MPDCFSGPGIVRPRLAEFDFSRTIGLLVAPHAEASRLLGTNRTVRILIETIEAMQAGVEQE